MYDPEAPLEPIPKADALDGYTQPEILPTIIGNQGLEPTKE